MTWKLQQRVKKSRQYRNKAEELFAEQAKTRGWFVTKRGYPDFICYLPDGEVVLVEVKTRKNIKLRKAQYDLMNALKRCGIKCYRWSPDQDWLTK